MPRAKYTCPNCNRVGEKVVLYLSTNIDSPALHVCGHCVLKVCMQTTGQHYYHCEFCNEHNRDRDYHTLFAYGAESPWADMLQTPYCCPACAVKLGVYRPPEPMSNCELCGVLVGESRKSKLSGVVKHNRKKYHNPNVCPKCAYRYTDTQCHHCGVMHGRDMFVLRPEQIREQERTEEEKAYKPPETDGKTPFRWTAIPINAIEENAVGTVRFERTTADERVIVRRVCTTCLRKTPYHKCKYCGLHTNKVDTKGMCADCHGKEPRTCDICSETLYADSCVKHGDGGVIFNTKIIKEICTDCYRRWRSTCAKCGVTAVPKSKLGHWHHYNDAYCSKCTPVPMVHSHDFAPKFRFFGTPENKLYFGIENEIDFADPKSAPIMRKRMKGLEDNMWLMHDGTLRCGIEIGYHPMSYDFFMSNGHLFPDFSDVVNTKYMCQGTHVHLSKDAFTTLHLYRFLAFMTDNVSSIQVLARRPLDQEKYTYWQKGDMGTHNSNSLIVKIAKEKGQRNRYRFLNVTRNTVEVRMFLSAWDFKQMAVYIQFLDAVYHYTIKERRKAMSWENFLMFSEKSEKNYGILFSAINSLNLRKGA